MSLLLLLSGTDAGIKTSSDTASVAEATAIVATLSATDDATATENAARPVLAADTASATESASLATARQSADSATAVEGASVAPVASDSAASVELGALAATSLAVDLGAGLEAVAAMSAALATGDVANGTDGITALAQGDNKSVTDGGAAVEVTSIVAARTVGDTAGSSEAHAPIRLVAADVALIDEADTALTAQLAGTDQAHGLETAGAPATLFGSDVVLVADVAGVLATRTTADSAGTSDGAGLIAGATGADSGHAADAASVIASGDLPAGKFSSVALDGASFTTQPNPDAEFSSEAFDAMFTVDAIAGAGFAASAASGGRFS